MRGVRIINIAINGQTFPVSPICKKNDEKNFFTIIIGNNAAGKSRFLVNILNSLRQASNQRLRNKANEIEIELIYNGKKHFIKNTNLSETLELQKEINLLSISNLSLIHI